MNVQIEKFKTRFIIECKYNEEIMTLIQKYEKKLWTKEKLEWSLPIEALQDITNDMQKLAGIQIDIKDNKPYAILSKVGDKVELKFAQFVNQFDEFKAIDQVSYDKENRKLILPEIKLNEVLQVLSENKIDFMYDTRYNDRVEGGKLKVSNKVNKNTQSDSDKPKTSKRKLSPEGSSTKPIII